MANAPQTIEGAAFWRLMRRSGAWTGGGMVPQRLNRSEIRTRLTQVDAWVLDDFMDAFEAAALAAMAESRDRPEAQSDG